MIAKIELSAKYMQQEHGLSFEDACWVVDKMIEYEKYGIRGKIIEEDHVAMIVVSAKTVQQEHGLSFEDACWVVDEMKDMLLSFSEDYFVQEIKEKNAGGG